MEFQYRAPRDCAGMMLGHSLVVGTRRLRKGHWLTQEDTAQLEAQGVATIFAGRAEAADVLENDAASHIAASACGAHVLAEAAHTGRANLSAQAAGLVIYDPGALIALNLVDPRITLALVPPFQTVETGDVIGTVKIIPFAVPQASLEAAKANIQPTGLCGIAPFTAKSARLLVTQLAGADAKTGKIGAVTQARTQRLGLKLHAAETCPHTPEDTAKWLTASAPMADILLVFGASATADDNDVIPAAIRAAAGSVERVGMAADPGNLLVYGRIDTSIVIGLPGCAKSPALNGFDWVLERSVAGLTISPEDWARMAVGGLLKDIPARPQPRRRT